MICQLIIIVKTQILGNLSKGHFKAKNIIKKTKTKTLYSCKQVTKVRLKVFKKIQVLHSDLQKNSMESIYFVSIDIKVSHYHLEKKVLQPII